MNQPKIKHLNAIDAEFKTAFPVDSVEQMSTAGMQRLSEDLARVAPCGYVIREADIAVSIEAYDAVHCDLRMALKGKAEAQRQRDILRKKLGVAKWLLCGAWLLAWVFAAAWLGER